MKKTEKTYHLKNILDLKHNMKIVIDEAVELDEDDNFLINVGYLRVSTDRQADLGFGLDIQAHDFNEFSRIINEELFNFNNIDTKEINNLFLTDNKSYTLIPIITGLCSIIGAIICTILIKKHKGD